MIQCQLGGNLNHCFITPLLQRIKGDQIQKQLKEEKDVMADQITALNSHIDAQEQVIKKLEERERSLQSTLVGDCY